MASVDIDQAARVTFKLVQDFDGEEWQFGFGTHKRDSADWEGLIGTMESAFADNLSSKIEQCHLYQVAYSEWGTSGFTGFHQKLAVGYSDVTNTGDQLPPQIAVVVSLLNTVDVGISLKRRRGRIFMGQIPEAYEDAQGRLGSTFQAAYLTAWQAMDAAARTVPAGTGTEDFDGLCVVSQAEGSLISCDKIGVGVGFDTQRRRRRKVAEAIVYVDVPA